MPPRKSSSFGSATSAESSDPLMLQSERTTTFHASFNKYSYHKLQIYMRTAHLCMCIHRSIDRYIPWGMLKQTSPETSSVAAAEMRVESVWVGGSSCGDREKASQLFTVAMVDYLKELRLICP